jgi:2'-5' RNA ligase/exonuclease III
MAAAKKSFQLESTKTALALIPIPKYHPGINGLRQKYDKAYHKWPPHINLVYPFVDKAALESALPHVRRVCLERPGPIAIKMDQVGLFRHRKNATIFIQPDQVSTDSLEQLRSAVVTALGCTPDQGTHDGQFRPHLTVGQAGLTKGAIESLSEKVNELGSIDWDAMTLAVMSREPSGNMRLIEEIKIGYNRGETTKSPSLASTRNSSTNCFQYNLSSEWRQYEETMASEAIRPSVISILSYNLMTDDSAPPFKERIVFLKNALASVPLLSNGEVRVLCMQEVGSEMLPLLLSDDQIASKYPYATHSPASRLFSTRNLLVLASSPFRHLSLDFQEPHKSSLVVRLLNCDITVANVHLTHGLTDQAVASKIDQLSILYRFLQQDRSEQRTAFIAGDFNITSSPKTIAAALRTGLITAQTAKAVTVAIDSDEWTDSFLELNGSESNYPDADDGQLGSTFDRINNPYAAKAKATVDGKSQRYDRIIFSPGESIRVTDFVVIGKPDEQGHCVSDHYGVFASFQPQSNLVNATHLSDRMRVSRNDIATLAIQTSNEDLLPYIQKHLPGPEDRAKRRRAIETLEKRMKAIPSLADCLLVPLGSYALETYFASSDVDLLAIGTCSTKAFFGLAGQLVRQSRRQKPLDDGSKALHLINSLVPVLEANVESIKFDVQYCQAPELLKRYVCLAGHCQEILSIDRYQILRDRST